MAQLPTPHTGTTSRQRHTRTRKQTARPGKPAGQITRKRSILPWGQLTRPEILTARIGQGARQLAQTDAHTGRDEGEEDQAVDDLDGTAGIDAGDKGGGDAPPGVGEGEADAEEGEPGVVSFEILSVAHVGEGEGVGIGVEGFEVGDVVVGGGAVDVVEGGLFGGHSRRGPEVDQ